MRFNIIIRHPQHFFVVDICAFAPQVIIIVNRKENFSSHERSLHMIISFEHVILLILYGLDGIFVITCDILTYYFMFNGRYMFFYYVNKLWKKDFSKFMCILEQEKNYYQVCIYIGTVDAKLN
jgi:hypothetical protein